MNPKLADLRVLARAEVGDNLAKDADRVGVVLGQVVGDPGDLGVHPGAAEIFGGDLLARNSGLRR